MENPEAMFDALSLRSLKKRYPAIKSSSPVSSMLATPTTQAATSFFVLPTSLQRPSGVSGTFPADAVLEHLVQDFAIDDAISDCFADLDGDLENNNNAEKKCRPLFLTSIPEATTRTTSAAVWPGEECTSSNPAGNNAPRTTNLKSTETPNHPSRAPLCQEDEASEAISLRGPWMDIPIPSPVQKSNPPFTLSGETILMNKNKENVSSFQPLIKPSREKKSLPGDTTANAPTKSRPTFDSSSIYEPNSVKQFVTSLLYTKPPALSQNLAASRQAKTPSGKSASYFAEGKSTFNNNPKSPHPAESRNLKTAEHKPVSASNMEPSSPELIEHHKASSMNQRLNLSLASTSGQQIQSIAAKHVQNADHYSPSSSGDGNDGNFDVAKTVTILEVLCEELVRHCRLMGKCPPHDIFSGGVNQGANMDPRSPSIPVDCCCKMDKDTELQGWLNGDDESLLDKNIVRCLTKNAKTLLLNKATHVEVQGRIRDMLASHLPTFPTQRSTVHQHTQTPTSLPPPAGATLSPSSSSSLCSVSTATACDSPLYENEVSLLKLVREGNSAKLIGPKTTAKYQELACADVNFAESAPQSRVNSASPRNATVFLSPEEDMVRHALIADSSVTLAPCATSEMNSEVNNVTSIGQRNCGVNRELAIKANTFGGSSKRDSVVGKDEENLKYHVINSRNSQTHAEDSANNCNTYSADIDNNKANNSNRSSSNNNLSNHNNINNKNIVNNNSSTPSPTKSPRKPRPHIKRGQRRSHSAGAIRGRSAAFIDSSSSSSEDDQSHTRTTLSSDLQSEGHRRDCTRSGRNRSNSATRHHGHFSSGQSTLSRSDAFSDFPPSETQGRTNLENSRSESRRKRYQLPESKGPSARYDQVTGGKEGRGYRSGAPSRRAGWLLGGRNSERCNMCHGIRCERPDNLTAGCGNREVVGPEVMGGAGDGTRINLPHENLSDDALRVQRLKRHLHSVRKLQEKNRKVVETIVTGTGERIAPPPRNSRGSNFQGSHPSSRDTAERQRPSSPSIWNALLNADKDQGKLEGGETTGNSPKRPAITTTTRNNLPSDLKVRELTESEFEETFERRNDVTVRKRREMDAGIPWDQLEFSSMESDVTITDWSDGEQ